MKLNNKTSVIIILILVLFVKDAHSTSLIRQVMDSAYAKVQSMTSALQDAFVELQAQWEEAKKSARFATDLAKQLKQINQKWQELKQFYEMLQRMKNAVTNFNPSDLASFISQTEEFINAVDDAFDKTEGLLNKAEDTSDVINSMFPIIQGTYSGDSEFLKDFFKKSEEQKHYSYKNTLSEFRQNRERWRSAKTELRKLQDMNNTLEPSNLVKATVITNQVLINEQNQLATLQMKLAQQTQAIAMTAVHMENQKKMLEAEAAKIMKYEKPTPPVTGAGLLNLKPVD